MNKFERQGAILRLVSERELSTQSDVVEALRDEGLDAVQATVSRDIAELGLFKAPRGGATVYVAPQDVAPAVRPSSDERLRRILEDVPITVGRSGLILVLTGTPGTASVVAQAIDESTLHEQEGTLAGDNTLLVLFADEDRLERWLERFRRLQGLPTPASSVLSELPVPAIPGGSSR